MTEALLYRAIAYSILTAMAIGIVATCDPEQARQSLLCALHALAHAPLAYFYFAEGHRAVHVSTPREDSAALIMHLVCGILAIVRFACTASACSLSQVDELLWREGPAMSLELTIVLVATLQVYRYFARLR